MKYLFDKFVEAHDHTASLKRRPEMMAATLWLEASVKRALEDLQKESNKLYLRELTKVVSETIMVSHKKTFPEGV